MLLFKKTTAISDLSAASLNEFSVTETLLTCARYSHSPI
jgi:hypothetical protein